MCPVRSADYTWLTLFPWLQRHHPLCFCYLSYSPFQNHLPLCKIEMVFFIHSSWSTLSTPVFCHLPKDDSCLHLSPYLPLHPELYFKPRGLLDFVCSMFHSHCKLTCKNCIHSTQIRHTLETQRVPFQTTPVKSVAIKRVITFLLVDALPPMCKKHTICETP